MNGYLMVIANTIKSTFTYRAHVFFQILTSAFAIVIQYFLWSAVYGAVAGGVASGSIRGMTFGQTFLYVSLATSIGVLMRTWTDWDMNGQIRSGDIIMFFFKPLDYMRFMFANSMGAMVGNLITITIPSLVIIFGVFRASIMLGSNIPFFVLTVAGSCVLSFLFDFIIGTTCFWTMSVWGISAAKDLLILFLSGALIPLQFYPDALLGVIRYLPFAYMYNLPLTILTAGSVDIISWAAGFGIQCAWIVAMWFVVRSYFGFSMRKLTVNGG